MDCPPHACPDVATVGGSGGFSGLSGRLRADNDAGVHRNIHAAVTADSVTAGNAKAVAASAVTYSNVTAVTVTADRR